VLLAARAPELVQNDGPAPYDVGGMGYNCPVSIPFTRSSIPPIIAKPSHMTGPRTIIRLSIVRIDAASALLPVRRASQSNAGKERQ